MTDVHMFDALWDTGADGSVISMGDFALTAPGGCTKFSFKIPSAHDIDFKVSIQPVTGGNGS